MRIMVFDVPAESSGALSVLNDFYDEVKSHNDKSINWIFVISKPKLEETGNIKVLRFPWVKKSWGHRLFFDNVIAPILIKKYKVDNIFSLQNVIIPHIKNHQTLYIHNSLPFVEYKFKLRENKLLWIYQNLIGKGIVKSVKKADRVIVQTKWMGRECEAKVESCKDKIKIIPPKINVHVKEYFQMNSVSLSTFFYPASAIAFKNHNLVVEACRVLKRRNKEFKVIFTLTGKENKDIFQLYKVIKNEQLPIEFVGSLPREQVFNMYSKSVLLFPSYVESSPLPLTEAKLHNSIILASDYPFSHEILAEYNNAYFFNAFKPDELAYLMDRVLSRKIKHDESHKLFDNVKILDEQKLVDLIVE